jgi:hypothetical protein
MTAIAGDPATAGLAPADVAMMAFAEKVARDAGAITEAEVRGLREHGLTDARSSTSRRPPPPAASSASCSMPSERNPTRPTTAWTTP